MSGLTPILGLHTYGELDDFKFGDVTADNTTIEQKLTSVTVTTATRPVGTDRFNGRMVYDSDLGQFIIWDAANAAWVQLGSIKPWVSFTPVLYSDAGGAAPVAPSSQLGGKYQIIGKTCIAQAFGSFTNATTSGCGISLPFTARDRVLNCGTLAVSGSGTPADQTGIAYMASAKDKLICVAYTNGFRDAAAGNVIRYNVTYELP